jgi:hypothetical protein
MPTYTVCRSLTDVEGNFDYFERYFAISKKLQWNDEKTKAKFKFRRNDAIFVFDGDLQVCGLLEQVVPLHGAVPVKFAGSNACEVVW